MGFWVHTILAVLMALIGSLCFSVIFNIRGWRIFMNALGGAFSYIIYLLVFGWTENLFASFFLATLLIGLLCEVLARKTRTPTILMLVPMLVPLIPGGDLYQTMFHLIQGEAELYQMYGEKLIIEVAAINFAILVAITISGLFLSVLNRQKRLQGAK